MRRNIYFCRIILTVKKVDYLQACYKIRPVVVSDQYTKNDKKLFGNLIIEKVKCWNGTHDLLTKEKDIGIAWANNFNGVESKIWCYKNDLKHVKRKLSSALDDYFKTLGKNQNIYFEKLKNQWNKNRIYAKRTP